MTSSTITTRTSTTRIGAAANPLCFIKAGRSQIVPIANSGLLAAKLVEKGPLKVYSGVSHGTCTTHPEVINRDLLDLIKCGA